MPFVDVLLLTEQWTRRRELPCDWECSRS